MISVISGTNRANSRTKMIASLVVTCLEAKTEQAVKLLDLEAMDATILHTAMYSEAGQSKAITAVQDEYMIPANKVIYIAPEYNGSIPGALKLFIDACSIRAYKPTFSSKKAGLIGVASGRAGNVRGLDHLRGILSHVGTEVMPAILPISSVDSIVTESNTIEDENTIKAINGFLDQFLEF